MADDLTGQRLGSARGRTASRPAEVPAGGWKDIAKRSWQEISDNNIFLIAGGVTYANLLALFPALAAMVSIYGLLLDPGQIERQAGALTGMLPEQSRQMLIQELHQLATAPRGTLGISAAIGLLIALWSASRGMSGLITALDIAYERKERRGFLRFNLIALGLTIGAIIGGVIAIALIAVLPATLQFVGFGATAKRVMLVLEWPLLIALVMAALAALYRYAPDRDETQWRWVSPGAVIATTVWVVASIAFAVYVANVSSYDKTYGSLGGAVILLTWLYLSAFAVLLGAVINAQSERQAKPDTGPPEPRDRHSAAAARGATAA